MEKSLYTLHADKNVLELLIQALELQVYTPDRLQSYNTRLGIQLNGKVLVTHL